MMINETLKGLNVSFTHLGDIMSYSTGEKGHLDHLRHGIDYQHKVHIKVKLTKCDLFRAQIQYFRHLLSQESISTYQKIICHKIHTITVLRILMLLQKPHQSLCQHQSYTNTSPEKRCPLKLDRITSKDL